MYTSVLSPGIRIRYSSQAIDLFHKWRPIYCSFQYMLISPTNLINLILLNFGHANEARKANFHENKRIIYRPPFLKKVYPQYTEYLWCIIKRTHVTETQILKEPLWGSLE